MTYDDIKHGDRIEVEVLTNKGTISEALSWKSGTVYCNKDDVFFEKRVRLDNGESHPIMPHRMNTVRVLNTKE